MHTSVLLKEAVDSLNLNSKSIVVDCTLGYGGHSSLILKTIKEGHLYAFDQDEEAIKSSQERLSALAGVGQHAPCDPLTWAGLCRTLTERGPLSMPKTRSL
jgi:16S rRNA C1402 N4-methylase RsmH